MFKKILVPLDGSELAEKALDYAVGLAKMTGAELVLIRIPVLEQVLAAAATALDTYHLEMSFDKSEQDAKRYFSELMVDYDGGDVAVRPLIVPGSPAEVIGKTAVAEQVDLIVISSHGRTGWRRLVLGSVAEAVLREATVPVLLIKAAEETPNV